MFVECTLCGNDGTVLCDPIRTQYKPLPRMHAWNQWLAFPVKYRELPSDAFLCITVWDVFSPTTKTPIGGVAVPLVNHMGKLKTGKQQVQLWAHREADMDARTYALSSTPGQLELIDEVVRVDNAMKTIRSKQLPWLDSFSSLKLKDLRNV